jgi:hypothetical protein
VKVRGVKKAIRIFAAGFFASVAFVGGAGAGLNAPCADSAHQLTD